MPPPSSPPLPKLIPKPIVKAKKPVPVEASRILHSLSTTTSPSSLPPLLSQIVHHDLHLHPPISSSFFLTSLRLLSLPPALRLFSLLPFPPSLFHFNSLLRLFSHFSPSSTLFLFSQLLHNHLSPNKYTFPPLFSALSRFKNSPAIALSLHSRLLKSGLLPSDPFISNSLLHLYSSHADIEYVENLFDEMPHRDVVAWTTIMAAYNNADRHGDALIAFERMHYASVSPNRVTAVCALAACAARGALDMGVWIHRELIGGMRMDVVLGTALVDMYGKCGKMEEAVLAFEMMRERNVYTWNAVVGGFTLAESGNEAVEWLLRMEEEGVWPDEVTLIEVLSACSHSGMVETGRKVFDWILGGRYRFRPGIKHYGCMVDLLGRAGMLDEAMRLIENMPFAPSVVMWGSLLGGCKAHGNMRLGEIAARKLVEMEPENVAHYVVLSNLYVEMGRWREAEEVRRVAKERGLRKDAGWSFAEVDDELQEAFI